MGMAAALSQARVWDIFANTHKPTPPTPTPQITTPQVGVARLWAVDRGLPPTTSPTVLQVFFFEALCGLGVRTTHTGGPKGLHLFRGLQGPSNLLKIEATFLCLLTPCGPTSF